MQGVGMVVNDMRRSVATLIAAMAARDCAGIQSMLGQAARLSYDGEDYRVDDVEGWLARFWPAGTTPMHTARFVTRGHQHLLTAFGHGAAPGGGTVALLRTDWVFTVRASRVLAVDIGPVARIGVPAAIVSFIQATNACDLGRLLAAFADDALVNDQLRDYWGKAAIAAWAASEIVGERIRMAVVHVVEHYNSIIVTAHVDGDYDKRGLPDPLVLAFYFSAQGDKIVQLIILRNSVDDGP